MPFAKLLYRREDGLGALSPRQLKNSIRVEHSYYDHVRKEEVTHTMSYDEFVTDFVEQGGTLEEAIYLLHPGSAFDTHFGFYMVTSGLEKDDRATILMDIIFHQLAYIDAYSHPNISEIRRENGPEMIEKMVLDLILKDRISIGAAINALEEILA